MGEKFRVRNFGVADCPRWFRKFAWNRLLPETKGSVIRYRDEEPCSHFLFLYAKCSPMNGAFLELVEKCWAPARARACGGDEAVGGFPYVGNLRFRNEMRSTGKYFWAHELPESPEDCDVG